MTKVLYKSYTQNDFLLFPPCIGDFIPENHPVRIVNAILDNFDISEIESTYKGGGAFRQLTSPYIMHETDPLGSASCIKSYRLREETSSVDVDICTGDVR